MIETPILESYPSTSAIITRPLVWEWADPAA
jgi:hypothetical protein